MLKNLKPSDLAEMSRLPDFFKKRNAPNIATALGELLSAYSRMYDYRQALETLYGIFQAEHRIAAQHGEEAQRLRCAELTGFIAQILIDEVNERRAP